MLSFIHFEPMTTVTLTLQGGYLVLDDLNNAYLFISLNKFLWACTVLRSVTVKLKGGEFRLERQFLFLEFK